jgi:hypothetical protein
MTYFDPRDDITTRRDNILLASSLSYLYAYSGSKDILSRCSVRFTGVFGLSVKVAEALSPLFASFHLLRAIVPRALLAVLWANWVQRSGTRVLPPQHDTAARAQLGPDRGFLLLNAVTTIRIEICCQCTKRHGWHCLVVLRVFGRVSDGVPEEVE